MPQTLKIFIVMVMLVFSFGLSMTPASAADPIRFKPQVPFGNFKETTINPNSIGEYIREIYKYMIGVVGILATVMMMIGGLVWMMAGGDSGKVGEAKSYIGASISGLVIAFASFMILATVNPDLTKLKPITVRGTKEVEIKKQPSVSFVSAGNGCCIINPGALKANRCENLNSDSECQTKCSSGGTCAYAENKRCSLKAMQNGSIVNDAYCVDK
jgi:hypothetical protein